MKLPLVLTALALTVAGCLQPADLAPAAVLDAAEPAAALVAHTSQGLATLPESAAALKVGLLETGFRSGEPTLGVTSDGTIYVTSGGARIAKSADHGETWTEIADPVLAPKLSLDPWIYVDPITDRVFNAPLYVACTWAAWTDDGGETWDANPATGCGVPAHDHQKLTAGPPAQGVETSGYPNVVYYQYNSFRQEGSWVSVSYDGGRTYSVGQAVHPPSDQSSGVAGPVAVAPDGTAYLPKPADGGLAIATTRDSGQSWEAPVLVDGAGIYQALATTVDAAVDAAGNAYAVYNGEDGRMYLTRSTDAGETWSAPIRVSPPQVGMTVFAVVTAGADGQVAVGYVGTTSDVGKAKTAQDVKDEVVWHAWMSFTQDATAEDPTWTSVQVTPDADPVQRGPVWLSGGGEASRNLLDFIDMVHHEGRAYMVYADGCAACKSASESRRADVVIAVVEEGPSLLGGLLAPFAQAVEDATTPDAQAPSRRPVALPRLS